MANVQVAVSEQQKVATVKCPLQCPDGPTEGNSSSVLTKSKKKRLRKRKKETENCNKDKSVIRQETVAKDKLSNCDIKAAKQLQVEQSQVSKTANIAISGSEVKEAPKPAVEEKVVKHREPQEKVGTTGFTAPTTYAMNSKADVKAQREAKKLEKQAKKNKLGNSAPTPGKENTSANVLAEAKLNDTTEKTESPTLKPPEKTVAPIVQTTSPMMNQVEAKGKDVNSVAAEKTREEIKAEREAKKQAKLASKNKKKSGESDSVAKETPNSASSVAPVEPKVDLVKKDEEGSGAVSGGEKSKAQLRAERRALQEAQRAAKKKEEDKKAPPPNATSLPKNEENKKTASAQQPCKTPPQVKPASNVYQPKLLSHLQMDTRPLPAHIYQNVHPAIVELGAKYAARVVSGSNARCIALLQAMKKVIVDFITPREKEFSRAMETRLNDSMAYLNASRQSSVSMTNALKHVKSHLTQLTTEKTTDEEARRKLCEVIDTFIREQIDVAGEAIRNAIAKKISDGDTIAIYGCSSLLHRILVESRRDGKNFQVVVVDGGPLYEGREMCRRLVTENIKCSYVLLPAFSYIVGQTTKVLLGAHALLANGCVMSRSGSALVAMVAKAHNVPVIVCCETYKFSERVQADAFVHNELGPQTVVTTPPTISLMYDVTPPTLVDAVATELAILPCTSVPVILRVKPSDVGYY